MSDHRLLRSLFDAALESAAPERVIAASLPDPPAGRTFVLALGKAAAAMARAFERSYPGEIARGCALTRYGHAVACERIEVLEAGHPEPDANGVAGAERLLSIARQAGEDDLVVVLLSGGGSALATAPAAGLDLETKRRITGELLASGASIGEINVVRKRLSAIKGGRLAAAAHPARVLTLAISDVPGDDPAVIASGPTVADPHAHPNALDVLDARAIALPEGARERIAAAENEPLRPGDPRLARAEFRLIATPQASLEAAADRARDLGLAPLILSDRIEGESREIAKALAAIALQVERRSQPAPPPLVLLSGGETTVSVRGSGRGGRNVEFALALAIALDGEERISAIACDTDGVDGAEEIAGAIVDPSTLSRARALGVDPAAALANNDGHGFFEALGDRVITGPTLTNVNDFRAIVVR